MKQCVFFALLIGAIAAAGGCTKSEPARFRANSVAIQKAEVNEKYQQQIANILQALYGTPDNPVTFPEMGLDLKKLKMAAGPVASSATGGKQGLYRLHCAHCHGITGDGLGPTAAFLNPYPRDYRQGKFKFKATERADKPTSDDLHRILNDGIPDTAMPSFKLLPPDEIDALVEYVKYLSLRGQTELMLINTVFDLGEGDDIPPTHEFLIGEILTPIAESWAQAPKKLIPVPEYPYPESPDNLPALAESIERGRKLFYGNEAGCAKCHGITALGDGQIEYDDWNKEIVELETKFPVSEVMALGALPPQKLPPRNLRRGVYRGGRRPVDLYRRLYSGINGVSMPAIGPASPGGQGAVPVEQIWDLVNYVRSLPYEPNSHYPQHETTVTKERL